MPPEPEFGKLGRPRTRQIVVGRVIGSVPLGTGCARLIKFPGGYYAVPRNSVTLDNPDRHQLVLQPIAKCA